METKWEEAGGRRQAEGQRLEPGEMRSEIQEHPLRSAGCYSWKMEVGDQWDGIFGRGVGLGRHPVS